MFLRTILCSCLLATLAAVVYAAPPACLTQLEVQGAWTPQPGKTPTAVTWQVANGRLRLPAGRPTASGDEVEIRRAEPLPAGGWTIDLWTASYGWDGFRLALCLGPWEGPHAELSIQRGGRTLVDFSPFDNRIDQRPGPQAYVDQAVGPVQWIRLVYDPAKPWPALWMNGAPVAWELDSYGPQRLTLPAGSVSLLADPSPEGALEVASFQVGPLTGPLPASQPGAACQGWGQAPKAVPAEDSAHLLPRLEGLYRDPNLSPAGRGFALAAALLLEQATGEVSPERWAEAVALGPALAADPNAGTAILPLLVATGGAAGDLGPSVDGLFQGLAKLSQHGEAVQDLLLEHAALLDPLRTAVLTANSGPWLPRTEALVADVAETQPGLALSLYMHEEGGGVGENGARAWLLPEVKRLAPNYGTLFLDYLRAWGAVVPPYPNQEPDRTLSFAAYRLAPESPDQGLELARLIKNPAVAAETYQYMADAMAGGGGGQFDAIVEPLLKQAVTEFKPSQRHPAPTAELLRLASWYVKRGRQTEAIATVQSAANQAAGPTLTAGDAISLYRIMRDLQMPEAAAWWDRAVQTGSAADAAYDGPEEGGTTVYMAATWILVQELVKAGKIEEALALARTIQEHLPVNYGHCLATIIYAVAKQDLKQAVTLLAEVPEGRTRSQSIAYLIPKLAPEDPEGALRLLAELPTAVQPGWRLRIAAAAGQTPTAQMLADFGAQIPPCLQRLQGRPDQWSARDWTLWQVEQMPLDVALSLEPYYASDRTFLARQLLVRVVAEAGLSEAPLWKRWLGPEEQVSWQEPWGVSNLRYAVKAQQQP